MMRAGLGAGVLAFAGLLTIGVGVSGAETIQTEGSYPTPEACQDAGPGVKRQRRETGTTSGAFPIVRRPVTGGWC